MWHVCVGNYVTSLKLGGLDGTITQQKLSGHIVHTHTHRQRSPEHVPRAVMYYYYYLFSFSFFFSFLWHLVNQYAYTILVGIHSHTVKRRSEMCARAQIPGNHLCSTHQTHLCQTFANGVHHFQLNCQVSLPLLVLLLLLLLLYRHICWIAEW